MEPLSRALGLKTGAVELHCGCTETPNKSLPF